MGFGGLCYYKSCSTRVGHAAVRSAVGSLRRLGLWRRFHMPLDALALDHEAVRGLMRLWPRIHWSSGDGMFPSEELLAVYRLAVTQPVEGTTVELGAWVGLTTSYLATACRVRGQGKVVAVDTFQGHREGGTQYPSIARFGGNTLHAFWDQIHRADVGDLVEPLIGYTHQVIDDYTGGPIRFLLIDADHSYESVRRDFELWSPLVAPGGLIVFHDYLMPSIARLVDEEVRRDRRFEFLPGHIVPNVMAITRKPDVAVSCERSTTAPENESTAVDRCAMLAP